MKKFLPLMLLTILLAGCNPSQSAMNDLEKFTERIETKSDKWSAADWDDAVMNYSEICETLTRYEYTPEEKRHIGELKGRCKAQFFKHQFGEDTQDALDTILELGGALDGFLQGLGL